MKTEIKAHPLMIFDLIKPFSFVLVLPFIRSVLSFLYLGKISGISVYETAAFLILIILAEIRRKNMSITLEKDKIILKSGIYFKSKSVIKRSLITSLYFKANPIERMLSVKTVYINTEAGGRSRSDFKIKIKDSDVARFSEYLSLGEEREKTRYSALKVAFWAAAASSSFSGLLIAAPSFQRVAKLLGVGLYGSLLDSAARLGERFFKYFPAAVNTATFFLLFIYLTAFLYQVLKNLRFCVIKNSNTLTVKSGVIVKRKTVIVIKSIRGLIVEQPLLMRLFNRFALKAAVGGYGGKYAGNALLAPVLNLSTLKNNKNPSVKTVKLRFGGISALSMPLAILGILLVASVIMLYFFFDFARLIIFTFIMSLLFLAVYGDILLYSYKNGSVSIGESTYVVGTVGLKRKRLYFKGNNLGEIKIRENPFDRKRGSCKARISIFSKAGQSVNLRWINKSKLVEEILSFCE